MTIRTTHVGSLPRTPELIEANRARRAGSLSEADFTSLLRDQVDGVVKRQAEIGLDIVNDGEYGHAMIGLPKSPSFMPVARHRARAPAMLRPWVDVAERSGRLMSVPFDCL